MRNVLFKQNVFLQPRIGESNLARNSSNLSVEVSRRQMNDKYICIDYPMPSPLDELLLHELVPELGRGEVVDEQLRAASTDRGRGEQMELL